MMGRSDEGTEGHCEEGTEGRWVLGQRDDKTEEGGRDTEGKRNGGFWDRGTNEKREGGTVRRRDEGWMNGGKEGWREGSTGD
jgi:hypothetical protein